jgi:hypothetical protein
VNEDAAAHKTKTQKARVCLESVTTSRTCPVNECRWAAPTPSYGRLLISLLPNMVSITALTDRLNHFELTFGHSLLTMLNPAARSALTAPLYLARRAVDTVPLRTPQKLYLVVKRASEARNKKSSKMVGLDLVKRRCEARNESGSPVKEWAKRVGDKQHNV